jgi:uncharacterized protein (TIGR02266 family)
LTLAARGGILTAVGVENRDGERVPAFLRIKLKYDNVDTFVEKFSTNLSKGGIFIASRTPKPIGTVLRFELCLQDASKLIRGEGSVTWVKEFDPKQPLKPHGMGVRFTKLDPDSRVLVDRMLAYKERSGDRGAEASGPIPHVAHDGPGSAPVILPDRPDRSPPTPPAREPVTTLPQLPSFVGAAASSSSDALAGNARGLAEVMAELARLAAPRAPALALAEENLSGLLAEARLAEQQSAEALQRLANRVPAFDRVDAILSELSAPIAAIEEPADPPAALAALLGLPPPFRRNGHAQSSPGSPPLLAMASQPSIVPPPPPPELSETSDEFASAPATVVTSGVAGINPAGSDAVVTIEADEPADEVENALDRLFGD